MNNWILTQRIKAGEAKRKAKKEAKEQTKTAPTIAQLNAQERGYYYKLSVAEKNGLRGRAGWRELGRTVPRGTEPASMYHPKKGYKVQLFSEEQTQLEN